MIEWITELHTAAGISAIIAAGGILALTAIIFAETGLLVGFFLPGDSLLITAGVLCNPAHPNHVDSMDIYVLNLILFIAATTGDQLGFFLGGKAGDRVWDRPDSRFFKRQYLVEAHDFYTKWGGWAVLGARYVPIFRTFVPFAAGLARMPYRNFVYWNIGGGFLWITSLLWLGYFLGQTPLANRLDKLILVVIFVSVLPIGIGILKRKFKSPASSPKLL